MGGRKKNPLPCGIFGDMAGFAPAGGPNWETVMNGACKIAE